MGPWPGARQLPGARTGPALAGGLVSWPARPDPREYEQVGTRDDDGGTQPASGREPAGAGERGDRQPGMLTLLAALKHSPEDVYAGTLWGALHPFRRLQVSGPDRARARAAEWMGVFRPTSSRIGGAATRPRRSAGAAGRRRRLGSSRAATLEVAESELTGESLPVSKGTAPVGEADSWCLLQRFGLSRAALTPDRNGRAGSVRPWPRRRGRAPRHPRCRAADAPRRRHGSARPWG